MSARYSSLKNQSFICYSVFQEVKMVFSPEKTTTPAAQSHSAFLEKTIPRTWCAEVPTRLPILSHRVLQWQALKGQN